MNGEGYVRWIIEGREQGDVATFWAMLMMSSTGSSEARIRSQSIASRKTDS